MTTWLHSPTAEALGWTLLHSLWQLTLIAALTALVLKTMRRAAANARYAVALAALVIMAITPVSTFLSFPVKPPQTPSTTARLNLSPDPSVPTESVALAAAPPLLTTPSIPFTQHLSSMLRPWLPTAVALYLAGALFLSARLTAGLFHLRRLRRASLPASAFFADALTALRHRLRIHRTIPLLQSNAVEVPTVVGILRPFILIPVSALTGLTPDQLTALLAHELAHIRRADPLVNLLQSLLETLLFYHPALWWLSGRIRHERELCADDLAIAITNNRVAYARALAAMETLRTPPALLAHNLVLAARDGDLLLRIRRLLNLPAHHRPSATRALSGIILTLLILSGLLYIGCSRSDAPPASADTPATNSSAASADTPLTIPESAAPISPTDPRGPHAATTAAGLDNTPIATTQILIKATIALIPESQIPINLTPKNPGDSRIIDLSAKPLPNELLPFLELKSLPSEILSRPALLLESGQPAIITIGQSLDLPTAFTQKSPGPNAPWTPTTKRFDTGLKLNLTATRDAKTQSALLDLDLRLTHITRIDSAPAPGVPADQHLLVAVPILDDQHLTTQLTAQIDQTVLIIGPRYEGGNDAPFPPTTAAAAQPLPDKTPRRLVVFITPRTGQNPSTTTVSTPLEKPTP